VRAGATIRRRGPTRTPGRPTKFNPEAVERPWHNKAELEKMAESVGYWWHSIDVGQGIVTKRYKTPATLQYEFESLRLPDLRGKTVLDIGAWDGFFSFERERRGARRVVALNHDVWTTWPGKRTFVINTRAIVL